MDWTVSTSFLEHLTRVKYAPIVMTHLNLEPKQFDMIDWAECTWAISKIKSPALTKLIWGQNPSREMLNKADQHPSKLCPLCDELDATEHYISCKHVNGHPAYKVLMGGIQTALYKIGVPSHMVTCTVKLMGVTKYSIKRMPGLIR